MTSFDAIKCYVHNTEPPSFFDHTTESFFCRACARLSNTQMVPISYISEIVNVSKNHNNPLQFNIYCNNLYTRYGDSIAAKILQFLATNNYIKLQVERASAFSAETPSHINSNREYLEITKLLSSALVQLEKMKSGFDEVSKLQESKFKAFDDKLTKLQYKVVQQKKSAIPPQILAVKEKAMKLNDEITTFLKNKGIHDSALIMKCESISQSIDSINENNEKWYSLLNSSKESINNLRHTFTEVTKSHMEFDKFTNDDTTLYSNDEISQEINKVKGQYLQEISSFQEQSMLKYKEKVLAQIKEYIKFRNNLCITVYSKVISNKIQYLPEEAQFKGKSALKELAALSESLENIKDNIFTIIKNFNGLISIKSCAHYWFKNSIVLFDPSNRSKSIIKVDKCIPTYSDSVSINDRMFILFDPMDLYEMDFSNSTLIQKARKLDPKYGPGICEFNNKIYCVGGRNNKKSLKTTEKYNIESDKWERLPQLIHDRGFCSAFAFQKEYIYAVGGIDKAEKDIASIERYPILLGEHWELIKPTMSQMPAKSRCHAIQVTENEAIIFGGSGSSMDSYIFSNNEGKIEIRSHSKLCMGGAFYFTSSPVFDGVSVISVDRNRNVHIYNKNTGKWGIVKSV